MVCIGLLCYGYDKKILNRVITPDRVFFGRKIAFLLRLEGINRVTFITNMSGSSYKCNKII